MPEAIGLLQFADLHRRRVPFRDQQGNGIVDFLQMDQVDEIVAYVVHHHPSMGLPP